MSSVVVHLLEVEVSTSLKFRQLIEAEELKVSGFFFGVCCNFIIF